MSPQRFKVDEPPAVLAAVRRFWVEFGLRVRDERLDRRWTVERLAAAAGVTRWVVYTLERGDPTSLEAALRIAGALGLRLDFDLVDAKRRERASVQRAFDPVHSAMGEFEARHLREFSFGLGIDEPYQHYQYAGRADVLAWQLDAAALLHIENRTRFPDIQGTAGSFNQKRAYLGSVLAERLGIRRWASETHAIVALWSAEVLHAVRFHPDTFRTVCPDGVDAFEAWWSGRPPKPGKRSVLVVLDPLARGRERAFIGLEAALNARPRYAGYAAAAAALRRGER